MRLPKRRKFFMIQNRTRGMRRIRADCVTRLPSENNFTRKRLREGAGLRFSDMKAGYASRCDF